jgi:PPIC-type PPIASE domain
VARPFVHSLAGCAAVLGAVACLSACGGGKREAVVVRVGPTAVTTGALRHWIEVKAEQGLRYPVRERRALAFVIASDWLIQQANEDHLTPTAREIERRIEQNKASAATETPELVNGTRRTVADLQFEAAAELASAKIRQALIEKQPAVTAAEIAAYYRRHRRGFLVPERRYFDIENLRSEAAALKVKGEVEAGRRFAMMALHEQRSDVPGESPGRRAIDRAVFAAKPGVLSGPVLLADVGDHSLFEVTKIVPSGYKPFAQVRASIATRLTAERQLQALAELARSLRAKWSARTDCHAGYVVPPCRQYTGPRAPEALFGFG